MSPLEGETSKADFLFLRRPAFRPSAFNFYTFKLPEMTLPSFQAAFSATTALAVAGLLALAGCGSGPSNAEAPAAEARTPVETLVLERTTFEDVLELNGEVGALNDATLSAEASGTVLSIAEQGAFVEAGQTVARLESGEEQAAVAQAQAQLETARSRLALAEDRYQRQAPLYRDSIISALEFEQVRSERNQARAAVRQAEAQLASAKERLANTRVRAPFSGTVEARFVEPGEQISPGQQVARIVDIERVEVTANVPERYANDIERGQSVTVEFDTYGTGPRRGQVTFVGNTIDPDSRTFPVEVEIANPDRRLKPEMSGRMLLPTRTIEDALVIPRTAVERDEEGTNVYVVNRRDSAGTPVPVVDVRSITMGPAYEEKAVALSGLEAGQELIVSGTSNIATGDTVRVTQQYQTVEAVVTPVEESENI